MKKHIQLIIAIALSSLAFAGEDFKSPLGYGNEGAKILSDGEDKPMSLFLTIPNQNNEPIKLTIKGPFPPTHRPEFVTYYLNQDDLAIIIDNDFFLLYRLYRRVNGEWTMITEQTFSAMQWGRRSKITQVKLLSEKVAIVCFIPDGEVMGRERKRGIVKATDRKETYVFDVGGDISLDNAPYTYKANQR